MSPLERRTETLCPVVPVELTDIYQCFSDRTRLRIVYLLGQSPLCVCHFQTLLGEPQVKISKHLAYLKARGLVEATREANWMIYRLPDKPAAVLQRNLACLQESAAADPIFRRDLAKWKTFNSRSDHRPLCCSSGATVPQERRGAARRHLTIS